MATHITQGTVTTYIDSEGQQIAEIDYDRRRVELGGLNVAGEAALVVLKDGRGREVCRINAGNGNLTIGGLNPEQGQDGDLVLNNQVGREVIRLSAGNAKVTVGGRTRRAGSSFGMPRARRSSPWTGRPGTSEPVETAPPAASWPQTGTIGPPSGWTAPRARSSSDRRTGPSSV